MEATFKFELRERVLTPFGEKGMVTFCGVDRGGNRYLVEMPKARSDWFNEEDLKRVEPE